MQDTRVPQVAAPRVDEQPLFVEVKNLMPSLLVLSISSLSWPIFSPHHEYPVEAEGDDVRTPIGLGVAAALTANNLPAVEGDRGVTLALPPGARADCGRQVET